MRECVRNAEICTANTCRSLHRISNLRAETVTPVMVKDHSLICSRMGRLPAIKGLHVAIESLYMKIRLMSGNHWTDKDTIFY